LPDQEISRTGGSHPNAAVDGPSPDGTGWERLGAADSPDAGEIGAAMAHQLSGPVTALLLHVDYLQQNSDRFIVSDGDVNSLKLAVDSAVQAAEQLFSLIHRMGDGFEAPIRKEAAIAVARDVITWWSRTSARPGSSRSDSGGRLADDAVRPGMKPLTRREREVLQLVSEGYSNKEGASQLNISYRTFECHRAEVLRKFGARNTAELVRLALFGTAGPGRAAERTSA
jgi:DNA-binding NarL/FixJ family response regulator